MVVKAGGKEPALIFIDGRQKWLGMNQEVVTGATRTLGVIETIKVLRTLMKPSENCSRTCPRCLVVEEVMVRLEAAPRVESI